MRYGDNTNRRENNENVVQEQMRKCAKVRIPTAGKSAAMWYGVTPTAEKKPSEINLKGFCR